MKDEISKLIRKVMRQIILLFSLIVLLGFFTLLYSTGFFIKDSISPYDIKLSPILSQYDITLLDDSVGNEIVKFGHELFIKTPKYIGPDNGNLKKAYSGNRLACNNCHLQSGTKSYSAPLIGIINRFPQFRGRENKIGSIEERINGCMERSLNGRTMPPNSKEMKAIVAYLKWLSRFSPDDGKISGQGFVKIEIPKRAVNLENGKQIFELNCIICHGKNGQGVKDVSSYTYQYPPLWGSDSYNNGAGMTRVITAAQFIKSNMPYGTTYDAPVLSDEEAYDVAGYINQQNRPSKPNPEFDFPDLKRKPVSTPYPPYADSFLQNQHQLGPFQPIIEFYKQEYNLIKTK
jgi:thiosulfate dehydrogenase